MSPHLFISPPLDDTALSCAGPLLTALAQGEPVVVASVFTAGNHPSYQARRREDRRALEALGIEVLPLGLDDAPSRLQRRLSFSSLALGAKPSARDISAVGAILAKVVRHFSPCQLWFPLGVGGHVDHLCVHQVGATFDKVPYYFDRPYAFSKALLGLRLAEITGFWPWQRACEDCDWPPALDGLFTSEERALCTEPLLKRIKRKRAPSGIRVICQEIPFAANILVRASRLIRCYVSQQQFFFGTHSVEGAYVEHGGTEQGGFFAARATLCQAQA